MPTSFCHLDLIQPGFPSLNSSMARFEPKGLGRFPNVGVVLPASPVRVSCFEDSSLTSGVKAWCRQRDGTLWNCKEASLHGLIQYCRSRPRWILSSRRVCRWCIGLGTDTRCLGLFGGNMKTTKRPRSRSRSRGSPGEFVEMISEFDMIWSEKENVVTRSWSVIQADSGWHCCNCPWNVDFISTEPTKRTTTIHSPSEHLVWYRNSTSFRIDSRK